MRTSEHRRESRRRRAERRAERRANRYDYEYEKPEYGPGRTRRSEYGVTLYRSRDGMICGVCRGLADYYSFDVFWMRVLFVFAMTMTGFWPAVIMYFVAAIIMKMEPVLPLKSEEDEEFYHSYSGSRTMALQRLKRTFDGLDRRIQRIENTVTNRDFDWDRRLNE
jgi:phage shock protein C